MVTHDYGLHHFHKRKRIYQKHEPYPHPNKWKKFMDKAIYAVGIFGPVMTLPQIKKIWLDHNASGVSAVSWVAYTITSSFWLTYGIMHKEKPIAITSGIWIILDILIVIGIVIY